MEINVNNTVGNNLTYNITKTSGNTVFDGASQKQETGESNDASSGLIPTNKSLNRNDLDKVTDEMNHFMESINTDIRFKLHEKTQRLFVQVIDQRDNKVLKEFPPHQLLDTIAAIRDRIGMLLDKKA